MKRVFFFDDDESFFFDDDDESFFLTGPVRARMRLSCILATRTSARFWHC